MARRKKQAQDPAQKVIARNRRARFNYHLELAVEAGVVLLGTEVKSLRERGASLEQAWCRLEGEELWLVGANIPVYKAGSWTNHEPTRPRKLLLHRRQIKKIAAALSARGRTLVPLRLYWNGKGTVKLEIALATGKKQHDKRQAMAERDSRREMERALKHR